MSQQDVFQIRMMPSVNAGHNNATTAGGRKVSGSPGQVVDVPLGDNHGLAWIPVAFSGTTAQRPTFDLTGERRYFFDTTLGKLVVHDGANWRDPATGSTV